jgi:hypothetical protein
MSKLVQGDIVRVTCQYPQPSLKDCIGVVEVIGNWANDAGYVWYGIRFPLQPTLSWAFNDSVEKVGHVD